MKCFHSESPFLILPNFTKLSWEKYRLRLLQKHGFWKTLRSSTNDLLNSSNASRILLARQYWAYRCFCCCPSSHSLSSSIRRGQYFTGRNGLVKMEKCFSSLNSVPWYK